MLLLVSINCIIRTIYYFVICFVIYDGQRPAGGTDNIEHEAIKHFVMILGVKCAYRAHDMTIFKLHVRKDRVKL